MTAPPGEWFRSQAEACGDVFFVLRVSPDRALEFISETVLDQVGHAADAFARDPLLFDSLVDPRDAEAFAAVLALPAGEHRRSVIRFRRADGGQAWLEAVLASVERDDGSRAIEGCVRDVTEMREAQRALAESEELYRLLAENAWDVIWTMELDGTISYVSPAVERMRGITPAEAMAQSLDQIHPPETAAKVGAYFADLFGHMARGEVPPRYRGEHEYYRKDGSIMLGELDVIPQVNREGAVVRILGVTRDISAQRALEEELGRLALTDPLTGAWNRRQGEQIFATDLAEVVRYGTAMSMLLIDIDHFKQVNDARGHHVGDKVLLALTGVIRDNLRSADTLVRWGGEEFVVVARQTPLAEALALAEKLRLLVEESSLPEVGRVTVSIGVAQAWPDDDLAGWMARADEAMYAAKEAGRNRVRAYEQLAQE